MRNAARSGILGIAEMTLMAEGPRQYPGWMRRMLAPAGTGVEEEEEEEVKKSQEEDEEAVMAEI